MRLASRDGLEGLTIGTLSSELGLSKSGLFAHFGSKDELQLQVLQAAVERFEEDGDPPGLESAARASPGIRALFENWLVWENDRSLPGGCPLIAASIELDDRPGPLRDFLVAGPAPPLRIHGQGGAAGRRSRPLPGGSRRGAVCLRDQRHRPRLPPLPSHAPRREGWRARPRRLRAPARTIPEPDPGLLWSQPWRQRPCTHQKIVRPFVL